jgi:streptogramin lyase
VTLLNGLKSADLNNPNLIDFNLWNMVNPDFWKKIATFNDEIIVLNNNNRIYRYTGTSFIEVYNLNATWVDMRAKGDYLVTCTATTATVLNSDFAPILQLTTSQIPDFDSVFTAVSFLNDALYIGTSENGLVEVPLNQPNNLQIILPNGPFFNNIFSIQTAPSGDFLWAVYGDYSEAYNPYPLDELGVSKYSEGSWLNIPYEDLLEAKSIVRAVINPNNENQTYFSSYFSGVLKLENDVPVTLYNHTTPNGPETLALPGNPAYIDIRMNGSAFDRNGNVWFTNSFINNAMKVLRTNGQWQSYSIEIVADNALVLSYGRMVIDRNNTKWFVSNREGAFGFNENSNPQFKKVKTQDDEGYPFTDTRAIAIDNRNQLWIGSVGGLRVLSNVNQFNSPDDLVSRPIIFVEDDLPQELLANQFITDIAVDGANNKWIGTADAGVFLLSPNGQETLQRFTVNNSPLPSNFINDIAINGKTGEVFFATDKGMVSFKGTSTKGNDNLNNVIVYPNPVRPGFTGTVKITGLLDKANVKITDISGNLVFEQISAGGTIEWDTTAFGKYKVASGVYMIFITSEDATETKVSKVMIIR